MNGDLFAGRFRLSGLLGTGGDASVYRAVDVRSGDDVAVKVLHPHLATETGFRERFLAQARLAAAVRAPGLVPVIAFGVDEEEGESAWLAMGVAPGGTLAERVRESGPLMVGDAVHLAREVLAALSAVHAAGLVHRDVTPSNVMVDGEGERMRAVLLDLGLAGRRGEAATVGRAADGAEGAGTTGSGSSGVRIQGTVDWMSPEHLSADPVDERGDVYQVGALLYFCVTGSRPFPRASAEEVLRAHRSAPPPIASVVAPGVPSVIDRVIVRAMLKRPADRYPSAEAMAEALTSATAALREGSPTPGSTERMAVPLSGAEMAATRVLPAASRAVTAPRAAGAARGRTTAPRTSENTTRLVAASTTSRPGQGKAAEASRSSAALVVVGIVVAAVLGGAVWMLAAADGGGSTALAVPSSAPPSASEAPHPTPSGPPATAAPVTVAVPPLAGLSLTDAQTLLVAAGLSVGSVSGSPSSAARDTVLAVSPDTGSPAPLGRPVDLVVATGENVVPIVEGTGAAEAADAVRAAGFAVRLTGDAAGAVTLSNPIAGTLLPLGQTVTLVLASAPQPAGPSSPPPTSPPPSTTTPRPTSAGAQR